MSRPERDLVISDEQDVVPSGFYPDEEYDDESISIRCVASWSIDDARDRRTVVNLLIPEGGFHYNSEAAKCSDDRLQRLIRHLQKVETGGADVKQIGQRAAVADCRVRLSPRDYTKEADRFFFSRTWDSPKWKEELLKDPGVSNIHLNPFQQAHSFRRIRNEPLGIFKITAAPEEVQAEVSAAFPAM